MYDDHRLRLSSPEHHACHLEWHELAILNQHFDHQRLLPHDSQFRLLLWAERRVRARRFQRGRKHVSRPTAQATFLLSRLQAKDGFEQTRQTVILLRSASSRTCIAIHHATFQSPSHFHLTRLPSASSTRLFSNTPLSIIFLRCALSDEFRRHRETTQRSNMSLQVVRYSWFAGVHGFRRLT